MAYSQSFNTPLVVFTSYNGDMVSDIPLLTWTRKPATALGLPSGTSNAYVYSNGTSFLAEGYANSTGNFAYYDPATKTWIPSFTTKADVQYQGNGVYLFVNGRFGLLVIQWADAELRRVSSRSRQSRHVRGE